MTRWIALVCGIGQVSLLAGCGSSDDSGACVNAVQFGPSYTYCSDDWEKVECERRKGPDAPGGTYHGGKTCKELGYTYYCASTYTYHMNSANCD